VWIIVRDSYNVGTSISHSDKILCQAVLPLSTPSLQNQLRQTMWVPLKPISGGHGELWIMKWWSGHGDDGCNDNDDDDDIVFVEWIR